jgi:Family of unknown function (DUF6152)
MRRNLAVVVLATAVLLAVCVPLFAHHGAAVYDTTKSLMVKGTVTDWMWANPHCWLKVDARDENGETVHWIIENQAPVNIANYGWSKGTFKPGDEVVVEVQPYKNQSASAPIGRFSGRVTINGQVFKSKSGER